MAGKEPFQHRPYDGSSQPFTVGLKPVDEKDWLEPDPLFAAHLVEKERLIATAKDEVFRAKADTGAAQSEVLELILDNLKAFHPVTHDVSPEGVVLKANGAMHSLSQKPALLTAARIVQEDLVLMRKGPDGYTLAAACLCFPSSWSLSDKFGQSMHDIHENVPGFNDGRMGQVVARLFDNLRVGQLVGRFNWSIYPDADLHHPLPKQIHFELTDACLTKLFLRVERQTLRRLPKSGDVLFTIKIHHDPLAALVGHDERPILAEQLKTQLLALDEGQLRYKGLLAWRDAFASALTALV